MKHIDTSAFLCLCKEQIDAAHHLTSVDIPYIIHSIRACSLVGRAPPWHGGGQEFESPQVHHSPTAYMNYKGSLEPLYAASIAQWIERIRPKDEI